MRAVDAIVERRVMEGRAAGYFDNLRGFGQPLPDIDEQRPSGWWAERFARTERHTMLREEVRTAVRRCLPALQRATGADRTAGVSELNIRIACYNRVTTVAPLPPVNADASWM